MTKFTERTEKTRNSAIKWGERSCLQFHHAKTTKIVFIKRRKNKPQIDIAVLRVKEQTIKFNKEAT